MIDDGEMPNISVELATQLIAMRDSLVQTSLVLRDWKCAMDLEAQRLAQTSTDEILKRHERHVEGNGAGIG